MLIEVILIPVAYDMGSANKLSVMITSQHEFISRFFDEESLKTTTQLAGEALYEHTKVTAMIGGNGWIHLSQLPILDNVDRMKDGKRVISIPYVCVIPLEIVPVDAIWVDFFSEDSVLSQDQKYLVKSSFSYLP